MLLQPLVRECVCLEFQLKESKNFIDSFFSPFIRQGNTEETVTIIPKKKSKHRASFINLLVKLDIHVSVGQTKNSPKIYT